MHVPENPQHMHPIQAHIMPRNTWLFPGFISEDEFLISLSDIAILS